MPVRALVTLLLLILFLPTLAGEPDSRPNILVVMAEDLGMRVGAFGDTVARTPVIDDLAARGVRYTNTYTTAGVCAPSRAAHIMGMNQVSFGAQHMRTSFYEDSPYRTVPPPGLKAFPELLRHAGYFTFTTSKLDYQFSDHAPGSGPFTIWSRELAESALAELEVRRPFYGLINLSYTHESRLFNGNYAKNRAQGMVRVASPEAVRVPDYYPDTPVVREAIARQYDNAGRMDQRVGDILSQLEAQGLLENTIIVWTTDHGDGLPRAKRELYDSGIHVPVIIVWPESHRPDWIEPGGADDQLVSFVDFSASFLALAGAALPQTLHGRPVLVDRAAQRDYVFAAKDRLDEFRFRERAVRDRRFKYIRNWMPGAPGAVPLAYREQLDIMRELRALYEDGALNAEQAAWFEPRPAEELYDTHADPDEVRNLAGDPAYEVVLERMRGVMDDWLAHSGDMSEQDEDAMARSMWPDGKAPVTPEPIVRTTGANEFVLEAGTAGASLAWRESGGDWQLVYPGVAVRVSGEHPVTAKSVRYGWQESREVEVKLK